MRLYSSDGRCAALVHERPITPTSNEARGAGYRATSSAPCDHCGETTIRELCAAHPQVEPTDRAGGYFAPWVIRCVDCFLRTMAAAYRIEPHRTACGRCGAIVVLEMLAAPSGRGEEQCSPCFLRAIDESVDYSSSAA